MKNNYLLLFVFFLLVATASCSLKDHYEQATSYSYQDFKEEKSLKGKTLEFDSLIMAPRDIRVYDSLLVVIDYSENKLFHVYNLNTHKKIGSHVMRGNGPQDMLRPKFIRNDGQEIIAYDATSSKVCWYELSSFLSEDLVKAKKLVKTKEPLFVDAALLENKILSCSYLSPDSQLSVFDNDGEKETDIIGYPTSTISYSEAEKRDGYYMNFTSNGEDRIAVFYSMTDLFEIYGKDGTLLNRMHGPDFFFPHFKEHRSGDVVTSAPDDDLTRDAFFCPQFADESLYVLYDGDFLNNPDNDASCPSLFEFSWDGKPLTRYMLDDPLVSFCVDVKNRKFYGISRIPEYHIVEYNF